MMFDLVFDGPLIVNCSSNDGNKELGEIEESRGYMQKVVNIVICVMKYFSFSLLRNRYGWLRGKKLLQSPKRIGK